MVSGIDLAYYEVSRAKDWYLWIVVQVRDRAWFVPLYGDNPRALARDYRPYRRTNHALSHLYHNIQCRPAHFGVFLAKDRVFVDCGTSER